MTVLKTHQHEGTVGASSTTSGEGYTTSAGAGANPLYVAGGFIGRTALRYPTGVAFAYEDNGIASSYATGWFQLVTTPTGDCTIGYALNTAATVGAFGVNSSRQVIIYSSLGTVQATSTTTLTVGTWYRFEWNCDGTNSAPQQTFKLFTGSGSTVLEALTGATNGVLQPNKWRFGHPQGTKVAGDVDLDKIMLADGYTNSGGAVPQAQFTHSESGLVTTVSGTDANFLSGGTVASWDYDWGDGTAHGTAQNTTHTYASAGTRTVDLLITYTNGLTDHTSASVTVASGGTTPPVANFTHSESGLTTNVDGTSSTSAAGTTKTYDWNWGDASTHATTATASHTYAAAGTYTVTLTVTASAGGSDTATASVTVAPSGTGGTIIKSHKHEGTIGATAGFSGEGYSSTAGAGTTPLYVSGGAVGASSTRVLSGQAYAYEDNNLAFTDSGFFVRLPTLPTGDVLVAYALTGTTTVGAVGFTSTGAMRLYSALGTTEDTSTYTLNANQWYKALWSSDGGGTQTVRLYNLSGTNVATVTGATAQTTIPDKFRIGHPQGTRLAGDVDIDKVVLGTGGDLPLSDTPPTAAFTYTKSNLVVTASGSTSTDPDDAITSYDWDWGDGTAHSTGVNPAAHTYAANGTYIVTLTVTDVTGFTGSTSTAVPVSGVVAATGIPIRMVIGGVDTPVTLRGIISGGVEVAGGSIREIVGAVPVGGGGGGGGGGATDPPRGQTPAPSGTTPPGTPIPHTIPHTTGT